MNFKKTNGLVMGSNHKGRWRREAGGGGMGGWVVVAGMEEGVQGISN